MLLPKDYLGYVAIIMGFVAMVVADNGWMDGHATFYGDEKGNETQLGACGYDCFEQGYGLETTALSGALFRNGAACGSCYELRCVNSRWCKPKAHSIKVTATNFCPSSSGSQAWCNPPLLHFDLTLPMFLKFAIYRGGIVPIQFRRIPCVRKGGVKFQVKGNPYFLMVLVFNVGGVGDVTSVKIKDSSSTSDFISMSRNWGMNWDHHGQWYGKSMSFQVTTSYRKMIQFNNVVPSDWKVGQSFEGKSNF